MKRESENGKLNIIDQRMHDHKQCEVWDFSRCSDELVHEVLNSFVSPLFYAFQGDRSPQHRFAIHESDSEHGT